jgi:PiT family inorganic phosphate transporter
LVRIEGHADEIHRTGLRQAVADHGRSDTLRLLIEREIYKHLERIVDAFEDVADEIDGIVIDHPDAAVHELALPLLIALIVLALLFDFLNGLHDAANSIATVVATRLLSPVWAVLFAATFNFAAYFLTIMFPSLHAVAETIGAGLIEKELVTPGGGVRRAGRGDVLERGHLAQGHPLVEQPRACRRYRRGGYGSCGRERYPVGGLTKTLAAIVLSPAIGMILALPRHAAEQLGAASRDRQARRAGTAAPAPGLVGRLFAEPRLNDAQKTMGSSPCCSIRPGISRANSTCRTGWRSPATSRSRSARSAGDGDHRDDGLADHQAVAAPGLQRLDRGLDRDLQRLGARHPGLDHHTITGAIIGAGTARRASAVRWGVAQNVIVAWFITIPASATVGALFYLLTRLF